MTSKNIFLVFILSFGICAIIYLSLDFKADLRRVAGISAIISVIFSLFLYKFGKSIKKWFRMNFDKNYKYNKDMPVIKKHLDKENISAP